MAKIPPVPRVTASAPAVGQTILVLTVTYFYVGQVASIEEGYIVLTDAAWVADTGRLTNALLTGALAEYEALPDGVAVANSAVDAVLPWRHQLPPASK